MIAFVLADPWYRFPFGKIVLIISDLVIRLTILAV